MLSWIIWYLEDELERCRYLIRSAKEGKLTIDDKYWYHLARKPYETSEYYYLHLLSSVRIDPKFADQIQRKVHFNRVLVEKKRAAEELADQRAAASGLMECPICFKHLEMVEMECCHSLCEECIHKWLSKSNQCPLCRQIVVK
jgi:hypothetical protein